LNTIRTGQPPDRQSNVNLVNSGQPVDLAQLFSRYMPTVEQPVTAVHNRSPQSSANITATGTVS
jgi:hypothetical protein